MKTIFLELMDCREPGLACQCWRELMALFLREGEPFELRIWREETACLEKALRFGSLSAEAGTEWELSVQGAVSGDMIRMLLESPKPEEPEAMTEFFTIHLPGRLWSAHYGRELSIAEPGEMLRRQLRNILSRLGDAVSCSEAETEESR